MKRSLFHAVAWLAVLSAVSCRNTLASDVAAEVSTPTPGATAAAFPAHRVDADGHSLERVPEPQRIVALLPSFTETLFAIGAGSRVVGVDDFSDYPPQVSGLPKLGGAYDSNVERVLALRPDLVLCAKDASIVPALERAEIRFWQGDARRFEDVFHEIEAVGSLVGRGAEAQRLTAQMHARIAEIERTARKATRVSVYYEIDPTPYGAGPSSFIGTLIDKAGGRNVLPASLGDFPKLSPELIVAQNPDVILGADPRGIAARPGFSGVSAVREGRVYAWAHAEEHLVSRPGPRLPEALLLLLRKLHPELR